MSRFRELMKCKRYLVVAFLAIVVFTFSSLSKFYFQPSEFQPFTINNELVTRGNYVIDVTYKPRRTTEVIFQADRGMIKIDMQLRLPPGEGRTGGTQIPSSNSTRILCWILTYPKGIQKAEAVVNTWLPRCDQHLLFSSKEDKKHSAIGLDVIEGWHHLTGKTMKAQEYLYMHHLNDADWFFKGDDDTYVIVENLRYLLSFFNPNDAVYLGLHFDNPLFNHTYMSGGAGYVISRAALKRMLEEGWKKSECVKDGTYEDADIGKCLQSVGVVKGATEDVFGRETFHPLAPKIHIEGTYPEWVYTIMANKVKKGYEAVSNYTITFHKVSNVEIYTLDFLIYHLKRYGALENLSKENMFEGRLLKN